MSDFRFAAPEWAYAFYALLVCVALLVWLNRRGSGALDRFVSTPLRERLVRSPSLFRRRMRIALLTLSRRHLDPGTDAASVGNAIRRDADLRLGDHDLSGRIQVDVGRRRRAEST